MLNVVKHVEQTIILSLKGCLHVQSTSRHQFLTVSVCNPKELSFEVGDSTGISCKNVRVEQNIYRYFELLSILHITEKHAT